MRTVNFIVSLLFAFVAVSHAFPQFHLLQARKSGKDATNGTSNGNDTSKGNSVDKMCKQMVKLTKLTELAANQTKLDSLTSKGKINDTELAAIKSEAADATTKLQDMMSNTTLVAECAVVDANKKTLRQCKQMKKLTKLAALANNQTAVDAMVSKKSLNDTQVTKLKEKIANASTELKEMSSNTTLTDICASQKSQKGEDSGSADSSGASGSSTPETATTSGASLTIQTMPYVFVPALAGVFALFL